MGALVEVVDEPERAQVLLHPARRELLEHLEEPRSAADLARILSLPRQRINYHLRELEKQSLVTLVEERQQGSCTEKRYQRTSACYALSDVALGALRVDPDTVQDRFSSSYQIALASQAIRDLGRLQTGAAVAGKKLPSLGMEVVVRFRSASQRHAFAEELSSCIASLVERYHDAKGRDYRVYLGAYPKVRET